MYNLSDKELDRLSREASSQHDPGDLIGPSGWDRLELHLDKELGKGPTPSSRPNPVRGIRGPFQYAPVIAVVLGVSYFAVRQFNKGKKAEPSEGPPISSVSSAPSTQNSSSNNPDHKENSTPSTNAGRTDSINTVPYSAGLPAAGTTQPSAAGTSVADPSASSKTTGSSAGTSAGSSSSATAGSSTRKIAGSSSGKNTDPSGANDHIASAGNLATNNDPAHTLRLSNLAHKDRRRNHNPKATGSITDPAFNTQDRSAASNPAATVNQSAATPNQTAAKNQSAAINQSAAVAKRNAATSYPSLIPSTRPKLKRPVANDSALLAAGQQQAATPAKQRQLHINRSLQIGVQLAPDFTSVNALAGDKPGSSIGVTVDYQILNRLYIGSGVLFSKKNYAARQQDCHMPYDYFRANNLHDVNFVKGTINMLEIPLNLRYDFSVTGNTMFFASAGTSSYISLNQRNDYYYNYFGRPASRRFNYDQKNTYLFSSVNLSLGVETGLSNNLSLLIAPYVKLPSRGIGFGEFKMNSVGVNFALKFAPVLSRKRK